MTKPKLLRALHVPGHPLVLPNAWDAASARAVVEAGFPAVATTSAGVAAALGFEDGERAPLDEMLAAAARIARSVAVPVTVDFERGYGLGPAALAAALQSAGAAGCNLEDTDHRSGELVPAAEQAAWLAQVRAAAPELVLNARVDVFLRARERAPRELLGAALERAQAYAAAGADCVYPIALADRDVIAELVAAAGVPVNVLASPGVPVAELAELGVARVSYGSGILRATLARLAEELRRL